MSGPQVYFTWPAGDTFPQLPSSLPHSIPPPVKERSFRSPFGIDKDLYNFALKWQIPFAFALTYVVTALLLNAYNRSRLTVNPKTGKKDVPNPWWIARQKPFQFFVIVHNVVLALYSLATFLAMWRAIRHTWPGINNPNGAAGIADALCKLHGPRGMGDAATFNTTINIWEVKNTMIHLGYDGNPDPTDYGRLWNEGLAFWGWIFYVSKFYEVLDTLIILSKGRRSPTLQTYHHAGAMLCMWAGIRYMSPPIWMFVFINSGIHAMMYTYYTLSALNIRVSKTIKRTLTTLQIIQFVFGASYAAAHLFVQYDIPIATPYQVASAVHSVANSATSAAAEASSAVSNFMEAPTMTASFGALFKKLLLRAAGEEGVAERIHDDQGHLVTPRLEEKIERFVESTKPAFETRWRTDWTKVNCIDTSGEAFAIYLNLFYLTPLTYLFARFFVKAYLSRSRRASISAEAKATAADAKQAKREAGEAFDKAGVKAEERLSEELKEDVKKFRDGTFGRESKEAAEKATQKLKDLTSGASGSPAKGTPSKGTPSKGTPSKGSPSKGAPSKDASDEKSNPSTPSKRKKKNKKSKAKQEENLAASQASVNEGDDSGSDQDESAKKQDDNLAASQAIRPGSSVQDTPTRGRRGPWSESEGESDSNKNKNKDKDNKDSDAMGQSGSLIDLAAAKAKENPDKYGSDDEGDKDKDPAADAEQDGAQWRPPGAADADNQD